MSKTLDFYMQKFLETGDEGYQNVLEREYDYGRQELLDLRRLHELNS